MGKELVFTITALDKASKVIDSLDKKFSKLNSSVKNLNKLDNNISHATRTPSDSDHSNTGRSISPKKAAIEREKNLRYEQNVRLTLAQKAEKLEERRLQYETNLRSKIRQLKIQEQKDLENDTIKKLKEEKKQTRNTWNELKNQYKNQSAILKIKKDKENNVQSQRKTYESLFYTPSTRKLHKAIQIGVGQEYLNKIEDDEKKKFQKIEVSAYQENQKRKKKSWVEEVSAYQENQKQKKKYWAEEVSAYQENQKQKKKYWAEEVSAYQEGAKRKKKSLAEEVSAYQDNHKRKKKSWAEEVSAYQENSKRKKKSLAEEISAYQDNHKRKKKSWAEEVSAYQEDSKRKKKSLAEEISAYQENHKRKKKSWAEEVSAYQESAKRKKKSWLEEVSAYKENNKRNSFSYLSSRLSSIQREKSFYSKNLLAGGYSGYKNAQKEEDAVYTKMGINPTMLKLFKGLSIASNGLSIGLTAASYAFKAASIPMKVYFGLISSITEGLVKFTATAIPATLTALTMLGGVIVKQTENFKQFQISLEGALKSPIQSKKLADFAQTLSIRTPAQFEQIQDIIKSFALIPATRFKLAGDIDDATASVRKFTNVILALAAIDPVQGVPGALFAVREALSGNFRSIALRFEVLPDVIAQSIGKPLSEIKGDPEKTMEALEGFTQKMFGGGEIIEKLAKTPSILFSNITDAFKRGGIKVGLSGFYDYFVDQLKDFSDSIAYYVDREFSNNSPDSVSSKISRSLTKILAVSINGGNKVGGSIMDSIFGNPGNMNRFEQVFGRLADWIDKIATKTDMIITSLTDRGNGSSVLDSLISSVKTTIQSMIEIITGPIRELNIDVFTDKIVKASQTLITVFIGLAKAGAWLTKTLLGFVSYFDRGEYKPTGKTVQKMAGHGIVYSVPEYSYANDEFYKNAISAVETQIGGIDKFGAELQNFIKNFGETIKTASDKVSKKTSEVVSKLNTETQQRITEIMPKIEELGRVPQIINMASDALSGITNRISAVTESLTSSLLGSGSGELLETRDYINKNIGPSVDNLRKYIADKRQGIIDIINDLLNDRFGSLQTLDKKIADITKEIDIYKQTGDTSMSEAAGNSLSFLERIRSIIAFSGTDKSGALNNLLKTIFNESEQVVENIIANTVSKTTAITDQMNTLYSRIQDAEIIQADSLASQGQKFLALIEKQTETLNYLSLQAIDQTKLQSAKIRNVLDATSGAMSFMVGMSPYGSRSGRISEIEQLVGINRAKEGGSDLTSESGYFGISEALANAQRYVRSSLDTEMSRYAIAIQKAASTASPEDKPKLLAQMVNSIDNAIETLINQKFDSDVFAEDKKRLLDALDNLVMTKSSSFDEFKVALYDFFPSINEAFNSYLAELETYARKMFENSAMQRKVNFQNMVNSGSGELSSNAKLLNEDSRLQKLLSNDNIRQRFFAGGGNAGTLRSMLESQRSSTLSTLDSLVAEKKNNLSDQLAKATRENNVSLISQYTLEIRSLDEAAEKAAQTINDEFNESIENTKSILTQTEQILVNFGNSMGDSIKSGLVDTLADAANGFKNLGDIGESILNRLQNAVANMAADFILGDLGNLGTKSTGANGGMSTGFGLLGSVLNMLGVGKTAELAPHEFSHAAYAKGTVTNRSHLAVVGEVPEAIIPLDSNNRIPLTSKGGSIHAVLPGGRTVPTSMKSYADGGLVGVASYSSGSGSTRNAGKDTPIVINVGVSESEIVGKSVNATRNSIYVDIKNKGTFYKTIKSVSN